MVKVKILQALDTLVGLRAEPAEHGGYKYTHRSTGYTFEVRPIEAHSMAEDEMILPGEQELVFVPLSIGQAAEVTHLSHSLQHSVHCGLEYDARICAKKIESRGICISWSDEPSNAPGRLVVKRF